MSGLVEPVVSATSTIVNGFVLINMPAATAILIAALICTGYALSLVTSPPSSLLRAIHMAGPKKA